MTLGKLHDIFPTNVKDSENLPDDIVQFLIAAKIPGESTLTKVLKSLASDLVKARCDYLQQQIAEKYPYKDMENRWFVSSLIKSNGEIETMHEKYECGMSAPNTDTYFDFSWRCFVTYSPLRQPHPIMADFSVVYIRFEMTQSDDCSCCQASRTVRKLLLWFVDFI
eukprot:Lithocolla_globosa_v1_NODE_7805_length_899_cov_2.490521.p1 type:complete len:166 gc:universal NODE_7805_length_899_cov_2.490521:741-244(-)